MFDFRPWVFGQQDNKGYYIAITSSFRKFTFVNFVKQLKFHWSKNKLNHSLGRRDYWTLWIFYPVKLMILFIQHAQAPEALGV